MNLPEIENAIIHLQKTCKCQQCKAAYRLKDIYVVASTQTEGLFDLKCKKCKSSTIVSVLMTPEEGKKSNTPPSRLHKKISPNEVLDMKNFLTTFDGNFKKIFSRKK